jgi:hypothetical protein
MEGPMTGPRQAPLSAEERDREARKVRVALFHAVWEASQYMTTAEIAEHVAAISREVDSDVA